ncbi:MAG: acetylornithine transaminase [Verrucomicrobiota bacterium]
MQTTALTDQWIVPTYGRLPVALELGRGTEVWDEDGKRYLDFAMGIATCSLGHCPEVIQKTLAEQSAQLIHCSNLFHIRKQAELAALISEEFLQAPGRTFFCNSGAEANEGLYKLARRYGQARPSPNGPRYEILTFEGSFHGRTLAGISATAQEKVKQGFGPLLPGFRHLPFNDVGALQQAVGPETVAILLECVQGEGGIHVATPAFLQAIQKLCQEQDLLLLADEVQAGFGRCGERNAWEAILPQSEWETFQPDAVSWAKGMGGGLPIGAFWIRNQSDRTTDLPALLGAGSHGTTYGGSPLMSAVSRAVLREILDQNLIENARSLGHQSRSQIESWNHPAIQEVRGRGLLLGIQFDEKALGYLSESKRSGKPVMVALVERLLADGLLTVMAAGGVLRLLPPLNVSASQIEEGLTILRKTLDTLVE